MRLLSKLVVLLTETPKNPKLLTNLKLNNKMVGQIRPDKQLVILEDKNKMLTAGDSLELRYLSVLRLVITGYKGIITLFSWRRLNCFYHCEGRKVVDRSTTRRAQWDDVDKPVFGESAANDVAFLHPSCLFVDGVVRSCEMFCDVNTALVPSHLPEDICNTQMVTKNKAAVTGVKSITHTLRDKLYEDWRGV